VTDERSSFRSLDEGAGEGEELADRTKSDFAVEESDEEGKESSRKGTGGSFVRVRIVEDVVEQFVR
jgi:hypothetical protein